MDTPLLDQLKADRALFFDMIPRVPEGRFAQFVLLRETESFPIFQTDGTLNVIRVRAGLQQPGALSRLVLFKRKQSTAERLTGRELLRAAGIISNVDEAPNACVYNVSKGGACRRCPDCIIYGFAIGDGGAEKSKIYVDSAFSVTPYEQSHKAFTFNAPWENGTMTDKGETKVSFGEQDHIVPQVFFPAVVTMRDPTYEGFLYVLGNLLRTNLYGAQETRTGRVFNHLIAVAFTNGEIFSNLRFTQAIYDELQRGQKLTEPLERETTLSVARAAYTELMAQEPVAVGRQIVGTETAALVSEVTRFYQDQQQTVAMLRALNAVTSNYAQITQNKGNKGNKDNKGNKGNTEG